MYPNFHSPVMASSFRAEYMRGSPGYRTPPPPDIEPLSPVLQSLAAKQESSSLNSRKRKLAEAQKHDVHYSSSTKQNLKRRGHMHRSSAPSQIQQSALELFATVVTSPVADQPTWGLFSDKNGSLHTSRHPETKNNDRRSAGSIAVQTSTYLGYPSSFSTTVRPSTSYVPMSTWESCEAKGDGRNGRFPSLHSTREIGDRAGTRSPDKAADHSVQDAELLLSFALGAKFNPSQTNSDLVPHSAESFVNPTRFSRGQGPPRLSRSSDRTNEERLGGTSCDELQEPDMFTHRSNTHVKHVFAKHSLVGSSSNVISNQDTGSFDTCGDIGARVFHNTPQSELAGDPVPRLRKDWPKGKPRSSKGTKSPGKRPKKSVNEEELVFARTDHYKESNGPGEQLSQPFSVSSNPANIGDWVSLPREEVMVSRRDTGTTYRDFDDSPAAKQTQPLSYQDRASLSSKGSTITASVDRIKVESKMTPASAELNAPSETNHETLVQANLREDSANLCGKCNSSNSRCGLQDLWITCSGCKVWFHTACAGLMNEREVRDVDKFYCEKCETNGFKTTCEWIFPCRNSSSLLIFHKTCGSLLGHTFPLITPV